MASRAERQKAISETKDIAQAMITCILNGDRDTPADMAQAHFAPEVLALVLADLVACVHSAWSNIIMKNGITPQQTWQTLMLDIANWREENDAASD